MRIGLLGYDYATGGGIARATINLAQGLRESGHDAQVIALRATKVWLEYAAERNVPIQIENPSPIRAVSDAAKMMDPRLALAKRLDEMLRGLPKFDYYIVSDDAALSASTVLERGKSVLWNHGELAMLLLASSRSGRMMERAGSAAFTYIVKRHREWASRFTAIISSSRLARELSQFMLEQISTGVIYPPVDTTRFVPVTDPADDYVLAVGRPSGETSERVLTEIAKQVPLKTVGGIIVRGATNLGYLPTDSELASTYANARLTVHPAIGEYFGYPVAESLSCGTPVLSYDLGGPSELIGNDVNGWLCNDSRRLVSLCVSKFREDYPQSFRERSRESAAVFSLERSATSFLHALDKLRGARDA